jgi:hypothetical protein
VPRDYGRVFENRPEDGLKVTPKEDVSRRCIAANYVIMAVYLLKMTGSQALCSGRHHRGRALEQLACIEALTPGNMP